MPEQEFRADTDALVTYKGFDAALTAIEMANLLRSLV